jgi:hypothetical protein
MWSKACAISGYEPASGAFAASRVALALPELPIGDGALTKIKC